MSCIGNHYKKQLNLKIELSDLKRRADDTKNFVQSFSNIKYINEFLINHSLE